MTDHNAENPAEPTPEGSATPPPVPPPAAAQQGAQPGGATYDFSEAKKTLQSANRYDLGIMAAGVVAFLAGFMPFYTISVNVGGFGGSGSWSAWHGFFGWFAVLVALGGAVVVALSLFNVVSLPAPTHQIAAGAFGLALLCLILALFVNPLPSCGGVPGCDTGHGFGYWLALLVVLAGTGLAVIRVRESTAMRPTAA
ncbi:MAG TPA: hypothetical protein VGK78_09000 [Nocardioides sp.]|uniref:hypothetical protein n=1 Tax=Nocardioides sp. TaxID=35761 RepID=UPI002F3F8231